MSRDVRSAAAPPWKVLIVDDEPAVHEVSRLILGGLTFEGGAVELLGAGSAAEARNVLTHHPDTALVLLDVVMETDDAGLGLIRYIREQICNGDMQIVLRTGQPGMAPERELVLHYEINGYSLKTDVTAQRLHSIVISALRTYRYTRALRTTLEPGAEHAAHSTHAVADAALTTELARARDAELVVMNARPQIALAFNRITGLELIPLWRTSLGLLSAERVSQELRHRPLKRRVVRWLVTQACSWASLWHAVRGASVTVSVPLVGESLTDCDAFEAVVEAVRDAGLPPGALDLLVSEAAFLSGHPDMRIAVETLRAAGVTFTLRDFGAQTISLQRLNQLIPDRLKIDELFVRGVAGEPHRMAPARSLIALAQTLNITAIADGISSDADAQFFRWEGCELGQGDGLAPVCAAADVAGLVLHGSRAFN